jgi:predicted chitinase
LLYALGTIAAENGSLVPKDEGVDYKSVNNNSAYEDFDVYEPFNPAKDKEWLAGLKAKAEKEHPDRHPARTPQGGGAASGNEQRGDGALYKGRGWAQLTHRESYRKAGMALGLGSTLEENPDLAGAANKENSALILAWQVGTGGHGGDQYQAICDALQTDDTHKLRRIVNGGSAGLTDFSNAYLKGRQFLRQAHHFRVSRMGL